MGEEIYRSGMGTTTTTTRRGTHLRSIIGIVLGETGAIGARGGCYRGGGTVREKGASRGECETLRKRCGGPVMSQIHYEATRL